MGKSTAARCGPSLLCALLCCAAWAMPVQAQQGVNNPAVEETAAEAPPAYLIKVKLPLDDENAAATLAQLKGLSEIIDPATRQRKTVILQFGPDEDGQGSSFEDSLAVARFLSSTAASRMRILALLAAPVRGHAVLPVLNCDEIIVFPNAALGEATLDEAEIDPSVVAVYESIAAGRGVIPRVVVQAMLAPERQLFHVAQVDGGERFVDASELKELRASGGAWKEEQLSTAGQLALFSATELRKYRWASQLVNDEDELQANLGIGRLIELGNQSLTEPVARKFELLGAIVPRRVRRFESNLVAAVDNEGVNSLILNVDSVGGSLDASLQMGLTLSGRSFWTPESGRFCRRRSAW